MSDVLIKNAHFVPVDELAKQIAEAADKLDDLARELTCGPGPAIAALELAAAMMWAIERDRDPAVLERIREFVRTHREQLIKPMLADAGAEPLP